MGAFYSVGTMALLTNEQPSLHIVLIKEFLKRPLVHTLMEKGIRLMHKQPVSLESYVKLKNGDTTVRITLQENYCLSEGKWFIFCAKRMLSRLCAVNQEAIIKIIILHKITNVSSKISIKQWLTIIF